MEDFFFEVLLGDRVETENAATELLVELQPVLLRAFHVHFQVFVSLVFFLFGFLSN